MTVYSVTILQHNNKIVNVKANTAFEAESFVEHMLTNKHIKMDDSDCVDIDVFTDKERQDECVDASQVDYDITQIPFKAMKCIIESHKITMLIDDDGVSVMFYNRDGVRATLSVNANADDVLSECADRVANELAKGTCITLDGIKQLTDCVKMNTIIRLI